MPLDHDKAEKILAEMRSLSIETRLKAIDDARVMYKDAFKNVQTDSEYSYTANVIEQLYNIVREELRVTQIRIKTPDAPAKAAKTSKPKSEKAKPKPPVMDMATLMANFAKFKAEGK